MNGLWDVRGRPTLYRRVSVHHRAPSFEEQERVEDPSFCRLFRSLVLGLGVKEVDILSLLRFYVVCPDNSLSLFYNVYFTKLITDRILFVSLLIIIIITITIITSIIITKTHTVPYYLVFYTIRVVKGGVK